MPSDELKQLSINNSPSVSASEIQTPPVLPELTQPTAPSLPTANNGTIKNVAKETQNFIASQSEEAKYLDELRRDYASTRDEGTLSELFAQTKDELGINNNLRQLQDIQLQLSDLDTSSDLTKTRVAGAEGQTLEQGQREITQEDRENAVRRSGLAAKAAILQGNIETANALAKDTVDIAFQDRTLTNQNLLNQIQDLSGVVDEQTQQLLDQQAREIEAEQARIQEVKDAVSTAILSGASQSEVAQMTNPNLSDEDKLALAQGIQAREARTDISLDRAEKRANISASNALAAERWADAGGNIETSTGETMAVPSFEEWAQENGGKGYAMNSLSPEQMNGLQEEYKAEMEVLARANALNTVSPLAREVMKNPKGYYDLTPTKRGEILEELSNAGIDTASLQNGNKKKLSSTQVDDLAQAQLAKRNVEEIYNLLQELPGTGPISGRLQSLNPYDPRIAAINAQINRTVPGLARGIFKEVGVLTDTDINRYTQTLANQNFTDEQLERLHQDTLDVIDESIGITTSLYDDLGYDLGSFTVEGTINDGLTDDEAYEEYKKQTSE